MIKNMKLRINVDQRGAITCGTLVNGRPKGLDHFDLEPFPELRAVYGDKPTSLVIYLPSDDLLASFDCEFSAWGKSPSGPVKKRICDGEECLHRVRETFGRASFAAGETSNCVCEGLAEEDPNRCRYSAHLKVYVAHPETRGLISPVCYMLRTHSRNSGEAVYSELQKVHSLTSMLFGEPRLTGIPFLLSVAMVTRRDDASRKFPIWRIQAMTFDHSYELGSALPSGEFPTRELGAGEPRITAEDVEVELMQSLADAAPLVEEIEQLGREVFGEYWERKRSDGALKVSGEETEEIEELSIAQLEELRDLLRSSRASRPTRAA